MSSALILGGARAGTGQATVKAFLDAGFMVTATVDPDVEEETKADRDGMSNVTWLSLDHADTLGVLEFLAAESFEQVVIVENFFYMENTAEFDLEKWNKSLAVNLTLARSVSHAVRSWPACASVTVLTSTEGFVGSYGANAYAATKAAIHNLVKSLAAGNGNIRYNAVAAGWIGGVMDTDEVFNMSRAITPLGRLGSAEEVAEIILFLATKATFVNGATVTVDGGYSGVDTISKYEYESEFKK